MALNKKNILNSLYKIAFADICDFADIITDEEGCNILCLKREDALDREKLPAVAHIKQQGNQVEIKLCDKVKLLDLLLKNMGEKEDGKEIKVVFDKKAKDFAK